MGKFIKVKAINQTVIELLEDASAGDQIDLNDILDVDTTAINKAILDKKDEVYAKKLNEVIASREELFEKDKDILKKQYDSDIRLLKEKIAENQDKYNKEKNYELDTLKRDIKEKYDQEINELKTQIKVLTENRDREIENKTLSLKTEFIKRESDIINKYQKDIESINHEKERIQSNLDLALLKQEKKLNDEHQLKEEELRKNIEDLKQQLSTLQLTKSKLNVKQLGEELETWCYSEYQNYSTSGFENTTFEKANEVIKNVGDIKGTKPDFLFKIYKDNEDLKNNATPLSSVCLEMKNESNVSVNRKKNEDYYDKLDKDRVKNGCEYALLVSELEWTNNNDAPIRKIAGYENMYMVRPQYFITFLSLIYALTRKFSNLLVQKEKENKKFKATASIIEEFNDMKRKYLEDQIVSLENNIDVIVKQTEKITEANNKIIDTINVQISKNITRMKEKIERFDIEKIAKKIDKLESQDE